MAKRTKDDELSPQQIDRDEKAIQTLRDRLNSGQQINDGDI